MHFATFFSAKTRPDAASPSLAGPSLAGISLTALALLSLLGPGAARAAAPEPRVALAGNASPSPRLHQAHFLGRLDAAATLQAGLVLPVRNQSQLAELLRRQYTPGDPLFHHFLSPRDFTAQFGPTPEDYAAVAAYARAQGLSVTGTSAGRTLLNVSGPSAKIEAAFGVQMSRYRLPDGRVVFANSAAPTLPRSVAVRVAGVAGLDNIALMHPHLRYMQPNNINSNNMNPNAPVPITGSGGGIGSGPLGGLSPNDIKYAYGLSAISPLYGTTTPTVTTGTAPLDGTGQNIGLFELDGYNPADIALYTGQFALPTVLTGATAPLTNIPLGGFNEAPIPLLGVSGQTEVELDIDMVLALAPAATGVYVYEADQTVDPTAPLTIFTRMANDLNPANTAAPLVQVVSCSWGLAETLEDPAIISGENTLFQQMAAQGQSLFCSSGDNGAYDLYTPSTATGTITTIPQVTPPEVDNPASQPYATGVGGTTLNYVKPATNMTTGVATAGTYVSETTWSAGTPIVSPEGSGGGISSIWSKPTYQLGVGASPTERDVPDVSLNADPNTGYTVYAPAPGAAVGTKAVAQVVGGTSAAAPLWAAFAALINQQRTANGLTTSVGFLNPLLYPLAVSSTTYSANFHDILSGSNLFYQAGAGYDDATGLGSFAGAPLLAALSVNANAGTGTATVSGTVTDSSAPAQPLVGATVTATVASSSTVAATATTDASGAYSLTVPSGLALKITVNASAITAPLMETFTGTVLSLPALTAATTTTENFVLPQAFVYAAGLQMISAPFDYTGIGSFASVFGLTAAQASVSPRLVQYAPALNSYVFYPTAPADTLRLGQGYWIRFPSANYLHIPGNSASTTQPFSIPLQQGWNQIGDPFPLAAPLSTMTVSGTGGTGPLASTPAVVQATLYSYNTSTNAYAALSPATDLLNPYVGYWIFAFQPCTLSVPVPASTPPAGPPPIPGG